MQEENIIDSLGFPDPEPIIPCSIYGKVIYSYDIFGFLDKDEPDGGGYSIATVGILSENNIISNHVLKKIYKDRHLDKMALTPETGLYTFMDISKNGNYAKDYYIIVHQGQEERIGTDNNGSYISYYSYVKGFYADKPYNFDLLPECTGYSIGEGKTLTGMIQNTSPVSQNNIEGENIFFTVSIIGAIFLGGVLGGYLYKFFFSKK